MKRKMIQISRTDSVPKPNEYIVSLKEDYKDHAYDEVKCLEFKGKWRTQSFQQGSDMPMDLEIGTGNGTHFAHYAKTHKDRLLLGMELKYKPLVQSIRRVIQDGCGDHVRIMRYNALRVDDLFDKDELNNVFIYFPDPWVKRKKTWKHRIVSQEFLETLYPLQKENSFVQFKTDSREYFDWALKEIAKSPYKIEFQTYDLHNSFWAEKNFRTQFENIFLNQKIPINFVILRKDC